MPHNRTRFWVGVAIVAVTIPAVGTFYMRPKATALQGAPIAVVGRTNVASLSGTTSYSPPVAQLARRDYLAEVRRAAGERDDSPPDEGEEYTDYSAMEDEMFDISPYSDDQPYDPADPPLDPASLIAPEPMPTVAYTAEGPVVADGSAVDTVANDQATNDDDQATPTLSDANVYQIVVNNLNADDRDEFVRAYAAMTPAQRADLLDGFRAQLEDGGTQ